jgi:hypothetical protein
VAAEGGRAERGDLPISRAEDHAEVENAEVQRRAVRAWVSRAAVVAVAAAIAVLAFGLGRHTAPRAAVGDYERGLAAGEALGVQEGRALQVAGTGAPDVRKAFDAGYAAGANDVFSGYDGGFAVDTPYLVTLEAGRGGVTYRIAIREQLEAGVTYRLCPDGHGVCRS